MSLSFYFYGTTKYTVDDAPPKTFSFAVGDHTTIIYPACLIWIYPDSDSEVLLCKIRRTRKPTDLGMAVYVYDAVKIQLITHGILKSVAPLPKLIPGRDIRDSLLWSHGIVPVPTDKVDLVKNAILKSNPRRVDESYFVFHDEPPETEVDLQANDALQTALRLFGVKPENMPPPLLEHQILDFDLTTLFSDALKIGTTPDGKHFFDYNKRRLYLHKVDRTSIERCLGVDLIYNFLDEKRLVFVQYKCQKAEGKYHRSSDSSHDSEVQRMRAIPGLDTCPNLDIADERSARLCQCPVFIKLCKRERSHSHAVPIGVYYPLCVWQCIVRSHQGVSVKNEPHFNNDQFQELVRNGLIGSTPIQSQNIDAHLIREANDNRLKLIFEEGKS